MGWATFDQDFRVLIMAHRNGIGVWVVEFLMGSWTRVGRSGYLEPTRELVWVCLLEVVGGGRTWCGCRVWSSGGDGCGGEVGGDGALRPIPRLCRSENKIEGQKWVKTTLGTCI